MRPPPVDRYDRTTVTLHWIIAIAVVGQWLGAHAIDWFPKGPLRVDARSVHITVGALLAIALAYRMTWRATKGARFTVARPSAQDRLASLVHGTLYILLTAVLVLGLFNTWLRGDDLFGLFHLPHYGSLAPDARHSLANRVVGLHSLASNALLILAGGHAAAALIHYFVLRDAVLQRMVSWLGPVRP